MRMFAGIQPNRAQAFFASLLVCFATGLAAPGHASVQMTQFGVDTTTPPLAPVPNPTIVKASGVQPLDSDPTPSVDPATEYSSLIRAQSAVSPLDNQLLGEKIDYYTGETDFVATDVNVPLNFSLPMAVARRYHVGNRTGGAPSGQFGDWDVDLPHIETVLATSVGWQVNTGGVYNQCSDFKAPLDATVVTPTSSGNVTTDIPASEYSQGYALVIPGQGRRELMPRNSSNYNVPDDDYSAYPVVTHDWWVASCKSHIRRADQPTEDFEVTSPDGVTYDFSYYTTRAYPSYQRIADTTQSGVIAVLPRFQAIMLPNTITDRFGNWVQYSYTQDDTTFDYYLNKITSSDGHTITISLNTDFTIKQIEDNLLNQGKVWKYTYTSGALTKVTLPDGSYWSINFANLDTASWIYTNPTCTASGESLPSPTYPTGSSISGGTVAGTIQHPTGASGSFTFTVKRHGRNSVPTTNNCLTNSVGTKFAATQPAVYDVLSLTKKAITGPNLPGTYTWSLAYAGCSTSSCNATKSTTVTDARGYDTTYTFGAVYNATASSDTEGQLQKIQEGGSGGSGYLRTTSYSYNTTCGSGCPTTIGTPTQLRGDVAPLSTLKPIATRTINQDGATYTQTSSNADAYGFPKTIVRSDGIDSKTDTLTYSHDTGLWVLGTVTEKDSGGKAEFSMSLNSFDQPYKVSHFGRVTTIYGFYTGGELKTVADGSNNTTTLSSYASGIPQSISYANSDSESAVVRYDGRVTSWTDADGNKTTYGYDNMGRLGLVTYPTNSPAFSNRAITWTTSVTGWSKSETVGAYSAVTTYDAFLQPVQTNEASTRYIVRSFDPDGRLTFQSYPESSASSTSGVTSVYDSIGRLQKQTDGGGNVTRYTPNANQLTIVDRDSNSTTYTYKQYDTPSEDWPVTITTPVATTTIGRDTWGKVTSLTRNSVVRSRGYGSDQLLSSITDPERSDALTFDYDDAGNLFHVKRNGSTAETRGYDTRDRLTSITYANGDPSVSFAWWPSGSLKSQSRGSNTHSYTYNSRHQIASETIKTDNGTYGLAYGYDALAHQTSFTYPDNSQVTFTPDVLGQPAIVGTFATSLKYYPNASVKSFTYGNGIAHSMSQTSDNRQLPEEVTDATVADLSYTYDGNAFPLTVNDSLHGSTNRTLTYDGANRLGTASGAWGSTTYTYNTDDTMRIDQTGSVSTTYTVDSSTNLLTNYKVGSTTTSLSFDGEGNLIQKGTGATAAVLSFDTANELTQFVQNGVTYAYSYDGKGMRATSSTTSGTQNGQQVDSVYNAAGQLVYESTATSANPDRIFANGFEIVATATQTARYIYLGNHAIAKEVTVGTTVTDTYLHTDALGTPIAQTDSSKNILATSVYLPFGGLYSSTGTGNQPGLGFASASFDATGLVYMHARYLDPQLRRFISMDPVATNDSTALNFNRFSYAENSPYAKYDPSGREAACITLQVPCVSNTPPSAQEVGMTLGVASLFFGSEALWAGYVLEDAAAAAFYTRVATGLGASGYLASQSSADLSGVVVDFQIGKLLAAGLEGTPIGDALNIGNVVYQAALSAGLFESEGVTDATPANSSNSDIPSPTANPATSDIPFYSQPDTSQSDSSSYSVPDYNVSDGDSGG